MNEFASFLFISLGSFSFFFFVPGFSELFGVFEFYLYFSFLSFFKINLRDKVLSGSSISTLQECGEHMCWVNLSPVADGHVLQLKNWYI